MRSKFKWIFTLLLAFTMQFSFAQEKTVTGVVSDKTGPLPGANIVVKGTTRTAQTDFDGNYSIKAKTGEVLVFSFTGYENFTATVGASNTINAKLQDGVALNEVVIDGYRTTSKAKSAVSQTTVLAKTIENRPNASFLQSLQGQVPGLQISTSSGTPGSAKIQSLIRGISSLSGTNDPLVVIDGIASNQAVFRSINPNDIESATILKDAAATAIYGNRATAGVIVVKTKGGKYDSKLTFRYNGSYGMVDLQQNKYEMANTTEILKLERTFGIGEGSLNPNTGNPYTDEEIAAFPIQTNWKDYFFRKGTSQSHDLTISGGTNKMTNYTSLSYFDQEGIVPTTGFKRFAIRSNFQGKSTNDRFSYTTNIYAAFSRRNQLDQETRGDINSNVLQNPLQGLLTSLPYTDPSLYQNGQQLLDDFGAPSFQIVPYMLLDYLVEGNIPSEWSETKLLFNASASYKLNKDLTLTNTSGMDYTQDFRNFARAPWSYLALAATPAIAQFGGIETMSYNRDFGFTSTTKLNYNHVFKGKHTIDANLFTEYLKYHRKFSTHTQSGLDPRTWAFGAGTGYIPFNTATPTLYRPTFAALKSDAGIFSYFATFDYDYDSKYGISGTLRRDNSFKFVDENKWATFWSVAGRWNVDKEAFMANSAFDALKLRVSYGINGNANVIGNTPYGGANLVRDLSSTQVGYGNAASLGVLNIANESTQWEETTQFNVGLDFSVNKRLSGSVDFYKKTTEKLYDFISTSYVTGGPGINGNKGALENKGVEVLLRYDVFKKGDFKLELFANTAFNKGIFLDTNNLNNADEPDGNTIRYVGGLINEYYVVPYLGVNNNGYVDADGNAVPANGNLLFLDIDGNTTETISDADRRKSGKSALPKYQGSFGFNASYKGFFVNTQFSYTQGLHRYDFDLTNMSDPNAIGVFNVTNDLADAWDATTNPEGNYPSLFATNLAEGDTFSDRWLRDASFVRLKVLTFGYNVPAKFLDKTAISSLRLYTLMENYVTWTKWRGFDPESIGESNQGGYPAPKAITFGVDIQF